MRAKNHIILFFLFMCSLAFSQVTFDASVSKKKLGINERLRIDFKMNANGDDFTPPNFNGFKVISGPNQSVNRSWSNGKSTFSKTYTFFLSPTRKGGITINNASIVINGETYKTIPIKITVTAAVEKPKSAEETTAEEQIHLVAEISNSNPYLNEAITVTYKLYFKNIRISLRDWELPKFNDFWSQEIKISNSKAKKGTFKGQDYDYAVLKKTVLYPQKTGELKIAPLSIDIAASVPTNQVNFFGRRTFKEITIPVTSGTRIINVKELPENGKPTNFSGAVGTFDFNVIPTKTSLRAEESLQAKIEVKGTGNLKLFNLPKLNLPSALEVYEPEHKENVSINASGMNGRISDIYTIIPQFKGKYPIPSVEFSYFDVGTKSYKTLRSLEQIIDVIEGPENNNYTESSQSTTSNKQQVATTNQFKFISTNTVLKNTESSPFFRSNLFWYILLLPLLAIPFIYFLRKKQHALASDHQGNKIRRANKLARKYLSEAKNNLNDKATFYESLHKSLHNYLKAKLDIETSDFSKDKIEELLTSKSVDVNATQAFLQLLENCELARYTPISNSEIEQDYEKAVQTISTIDNVF